ncbi:PilN domain-containing protein [Natronospora cellulosivora (SeqCode)]
MRVNLVKERNKAYQINWKEVAIVIGVSIVLIALGIYYFMLVQDSRYLQQDINNLDNQINNVLVRVAEYNRLDRKVEELENIKEQMEAYKYVWDLALIEKGYVIPNNTMLLNLQIEDRNISINGRAASNQLILTLIDNMETSPVYDDVTLINLTRNDDTQFNIEAVITGEAD